MSDRCTMVWPDSDVVDHGGTARMAAVACQTQLRLAGLVCRMEQQCLVPMAVCHLSVRQLLRRGAGGDQRLGRAAAGVSARINSGVTYNMTLHLFNSRSTRCQWLPLQCHTLLISGQILTCPPISTALTDSKRLKLSACTSWPGCMAEQTQVSSGATSTQVAAPPPPDCSADGAGGNPAAFIGGCTADLTMAVQLPLGSGRCAGAHRGLDL